MNVIAKLTAVMLAMGLLAGCGRKEKADGEIRIGYAAPTLADEGQVAIRQGVVIAAERFGWELTTTDAERDSAKQVNQIDALLAKGVDALVIIPVDSAALTVAVEKANKFKVPVITIDRKTTGGELLLTVQSDNYLAGEQAGVRMVELLKNKHGEPKGTVLELQGSLGTNVAQLRGGGFNDVMKNYPGIVVISKPTDWSPDKGAMIAADTLTVHPELDGIYWHSDAIGAGVVPALERLNRLKPVGDPGHIFLVGIDGMRVMLGYIRDKKVDATMSQNLLDLGDVALGLLNDHFDGKAIPESGVVEREGAAWSPAKVERADTGPLINLSTVPVDAGNADDPGLWGNFKPGE
jgi:ABC-type sugar transport system substrate-binding protein